MSQPPPPQLLHPLKDHAAARLVTSKITFNNGLPQVKQDLLKSNGNQVKLLNLLKIVQFAQNCSICTKLLNWLKIAQFVQNGSIC